MIEELRLELMRVNEAVIALERLAQTQKKRKGRSESSLAEIVTLPRKRGRPPGSRNKPKD